LTPNLAVRGVGNVLMGLLGRMEWGYRIKLGRVRKSSQIIPDLTWEMDPGLDSGMICGVQTKVIKEVFPFYLVLRV
jgi:hypothetical protein